MKTKIVELINASKVLTPEKKLEYLGILKFLSEEKLKALAEILEKEKLGAEEIADKGEKEKAEINKEYIKEIENIYKKEFKSAMESEEGEDRGRADDTLSQL